jgi:hypothetical protein
MYHDATLFDAVRHLAADDHGGSIRSFSFMRHDAQSFAEHKAENVGMNAFIASSFINRRADGGRADGEEEKRILRVTHSALDPTRDTGKVSVALDASASPGELDDKATYDVERGGEAHWGIIKLTYKQSLKVSEFLVTVSFMGMRQASADHTVSSCVSRPLAGLSPMKDLHATAELAVMRW